MRLLTNIILLLILPAFVSAQQRKIDSLNRLITNATSDTQRINLLIKKAAAFGAINLDSTIELANKAVQECQTINYKDGELRATLYFAYAYTDKHDYTTAKRNLDKAGDFLKTIKDSFALVKYYDAYGYMYYDEMKFDSSLEFVKKELTAIPSGSDSNSLVNIYSRIANGYYELGNFPEVFSYYQKALSIAEKINDERHEADIYGGMGNTLYVMGDNVKAEQDCLYAIKLARRTDEKSYEDFACSVLSIIYIRMHKYKEAYRYAMYAAGLAKNSAGYDEDAADLSQAAMALVGLDKINEAKNLDSKAIIIADSSNRPWEVFSAYAAMGNILKMEGKDREAISFYEKSFKLLTGSKLDPEMADSYTSVSECYEKTGNFNKALDAYKTATKINDTLKNMENISKATELAVSYDFKKKQELAKAMQDKKDANTKRIRTQQYFIIAGLAVVVLAVIIIALIQFRNNRQKQNANNLISQQKQQVETTLSELKSTQAQLIQSEKMASLGELTAGIAHEIQNPLNFVNNFSEVNRELISELVDEVDKGNTEEVKAIANDIKDNEEKINHHGKRADAIVKGMLQHSRQTKGIKEPTDINALCDKYLRLSYHGLRAKDKSFNADFKTDFDKSIGKINIVPQDIGRVLLNLINNAFYAVNEKKITDDETYKPLVSIQTKRINDKVEIKVSDNGNGIPSSIKDKIFQPFFTTKPTGQGTGLGLSLSYDIITKEHNGTIKVVSKEGEGSMFIISLQ